MFVFKHVQYGRGAPCVYLNGFESEEMDEEG